MSFENEFPSLKDWQLPYQDGKNVFHIEDVVKHCLDKQRVCIAIHAMVLGVEGPDDVVLRCQEYLFEELGL